MSQTIIKIEGLRFSYPRMKECVLCGIDLEILEGEFVIITGANGSGKTTLGKCINGLVPYSTGGSFEGKVVVCGMDTLQRNVSDLARYVGFVFSNPEDQLATPRIETEIGFGLCNLGVSRETILEKVDAIVERLGIRQLRGRSTLDLSTGEQQMVAIASVLVMEPKILILDDPLSHLNQTLCQRVIEVVRELHKNGTTILWISQDISELFEFADRVVLLESGKIQFNGVPGSLAEKMDCGDLPVVCPQHVELCQQLIKAGFPHEILENSLSRTIQKLRERIGTGNLGQGAKEVKPWTGRIKPEPVVRFDHVTFSYPRGSLALKDIDLSFEAGDFVLLSGWNGSGKTTLAKHINGLLRPTMGTVFIRGRDISERPTSDLAREVGFLFQNPDHQLHKPTVREELAFSLRNFGVPEDQIAKKILLSAEKFQLVPLLDRSPQELSGSEKKKVTVASVLIYDPSVVIFDEPTANLDRQQASTIIETIESYFDESKVIMCISHDIRLWVESRNLNRVVILKEGRVFKEGNPEQIFCDRTVMEFLYGSLLPITQIAQSLSEKGVSMNHYRTSTLVEDIKRLGMHQQRC